MWNSIKSPVEHAGLENAVSDGGLESAFPSLLSHDQVKQRTSWAGLVTSYVEHWIGIWNINSL